MARLMTYNIQEGGGPARRQRRLLEVIARASPDILVLNEATGRPPCHPLVERVTSVLDGDYRVAPSAAGFHTALVSRYPIREFHRPAIRPLFHAAAWITVAVPGGRTLTVAGIHLDYRGEALRRDEAAAILPHLAPLLETDAAVLGDLNALAPDDPVMGLRPDELARMDRAEMPDWLLQRHPPRTLPRFAAAGWSDAFRLRHGSKAGYTMSTSEPNARYDYILLSPSLAAKLEDVVVETAPPASNASDHYAVVADVAI